MLQPYSPKEKSGRGAVTQDPNVASSGILVEYCDLTQLMIINCVLDSECIKML